MYAPKQIRYCGIECLGAYYQMPENHYMWKCKCKVPDAKESKKYYC